MRKLLLSALLGSLALLGLTAHAAAAQTIRVATFNVSMEASNYAASEAEIKGNELFERLASGNNPQIANIATIIQQVRPDVILLNEFDYSADPDKGVKAFLRNYLNVQQGESPAIDYPYFFTASVNTGVDSGMDIDNDGVASGTGNDAFGYGVYPGQYGMVVLSRYPIVNSQARTFQHFLWKDLPNNLMAEMKDASGALWFSPAEQARMRLSSKSHWDLPIQVGNEQFHLLASHPTPSVFDGPENRNGRRNHDELKLWVDYLTPGAANYLYDDLGQKGGFQGERFVLVGDLNASVHSPEALPGGIDALLAHPAVNAAMIPTSRAGALLKPDDRHASAFTAQWAMRADYVLPSRQGFTVLGQGIFWPEPGSAYFPLVDGRGASSDHRLVWVDLQLTAISH